MGVRYPNAIIHVFEPFAENFELLTKNIRDSSLNNVDAEMKAIAGRKGKVNLNISSQNTGGHSIVFQEDSATSVEAIPLSEVFETHKISRCDLLKMDCEGAEYEILFSTPTEILDKVQTIVMEYHNTKEHNYSEIVKYLQERGFKTETIGKPHTEPFMIGVLRAERG